MTLMHRRVAIVRIIIAVRIRRTTCDCEIMYGVRSSINHSSSDDRENAHTKINYDDKVQIPTRVSVASYLPTIESSLILPLAQDSRIAPPLD